MKLETKRRDAENAEVRGEENLGFPCISPRSLRLRVERKNRL